MFLSFVLYFCYQDVQLLKLSVNAFVAYNVFPSVMMSLLMLSSSLYKPVRRMTVYISFLSVFLTLRKCIIVSDRQRQEYCKLNRVEACYMRTLA